MEKLESKTLQIDGMTCVGCERRIENKIRKINGIISVKANYSTNTVKVTFQKDVVKLDDLRKAIESLDYKVKGNSISALKNTGKPENTKEKLIDILTIVLIMYILYMIANKFGLLNIFNVFPEAKAGMSYGVLLVIGLLTSVHCVAMCGGINLSQCLPQPVSPDNKTGSINLMPSVLYNTGRVVSYTLIGGIVGALGSVVSFSGPAKGIVAIVASVFMVIMGINMLNIFPWLRRFNPKMPRFFSKMIGQEKRKSKNRAFYVGLLNGLMPCGPLQAMQLYALSTGDPIKGALSMFVFSIGTVPLMFGLGAISSYLSKQFTHKMMQVSAVLVIVLGFVMFQTGMTVSGIQLPSYSFSTIFNSTATNQDSPAIVENGVQVITSQVRSGSYGSITVTAGVPVKWILHAAKGSLNGCNYRLEIKSLGKQVQLEEGDNIIEFTPVKSGIIPFNCWMGMIKGTISVIN